jgi:hypothetical protein
MPPSIPVKTGAAGLAYDPVRKVHFALLANGDLYVSNGISIRSDKCVFRRVYNVKDIYMPQGGTQLLCDASGALFSVALFRNEGYDVMNIYSIPIEGDLPTHVALGVKGNYEAQFLLGTYTGDIDLDYGPSFRWGGGVYATSPTAMEVFSISRLLTRGPAEPWATAKIWTMKQ